MNINRRTPLAVQPQIILLIICALLLLPWLGTTWFNSKGEPREAIVAVSMLTSGDWILPVNYGGDIPFKPPFLAWMIAVFAKIFNGGEVNEYVSRLPSALACIAMIWAGYRWSARLRGERFAMTMALVTLTSVEVFRDAISCRLDMVLTSAMLISMYLLFDLMNRHCGHRRLKYFLVIVMMTVATLTKGPIGSALPCLVMGVYYLLRGERFWPTLGKLTAICLTSLVLPALWFLAAKSQGGDSFVALMMEENFGRLTSSMSYGSHVNPFWYNFETLLAGMAPWTLLGVMALTVVRRYKHQALRPGGLLALTAFILIVGFYCIPESKRAVYLLPVYPFLAYAVASLIEALRTSRVLKAYVWVLAVLAVIVPIAVTLIECGAVSAPKLRLWPLDWWMWPLLYLPLLAGAAWIVWRRNAEEFSVILPVILMLTYAAALQPAVLKAQSDKPLTATVEAAAAKAPAGTPIYSLEQPRTLRFFTLNYYLNDRMRIISDADAIEALPAGSVVLYDEALADTAVFGGSFELTHLSDRGCDHRHALGMAVRR